MAIDPVTERSEFKRQLTWRDGFAIALVIPVGIFATIGPSIGAIGAWGVAVLFAIACIVALLQNFLFAEMAAMFPDKPGGIALYAHEAWKRYFSPIGSIAALGYWAGWAFANAVFGLTLGALIQAEFFPGATWSISTGGTDVGLPHIIGIVCLISVWMLNVFGIRPTVNINKALGVLSVALISLLIIGRYTRLRRPVHPPHQLGGVRLALVFLFIFGWTAYGTEICATFAPEYRDAKRDTSMALRTAAMFTLLPPLRLLGLLAQRGRDRKCTSGLSMRPTS